MAEDWENVVIETGVDTLLNYLAENREAPVSEISDDLGVSDDRIKEWADALEESGFLEKKYSARKGMILRYTSENKEEADKRIEKLKEEIEERSEEINEEMERRGDEVERAKKKLKEMSEELEENREKEEEVKQQLEELEQLEEEIEERLQEQRQKEENVHSESVDLISRIDSALNRIEEAEEKAGSFEEERDEIRKKLKALKKLERHSEKVEEMEEKLAEVEEEEETASGIFSSFKSTVKRIFGVDKKDYEKILAGTVDEAKEEIARMNEPDYDRLLKLERRGENRQTLISYLERQRESESR
ncbi:MAG: hypothetical protein ABEI58_00435 [Candidatus Nanohaloarchaea archaeon]